MATRFRSTESMSVGIPIVTIGNASSGLSYLIIKRVSFQVQEYDEFLFKWHALEDRRFVNRHDWGNIRQDCYCSRAS